MKKMILTVATLLTVASSAYADVTVTGSKALKIEQALDSVGAVADCGLGKCIIEVSDVQCLVQGHSVAKSYYTCSLSVQSESGELNNVSINGSLAKKLMSALKNAGVAIDCADKACGLEAKSIQVISRYAEKFHTAVIQ